MRQRERIVMGVQIIHGDCLDVMRGLPAASVDSVVTDPPYGLEFMGKDWDSFAPRERKNASVWDGRRQAQDGWEADAAARSGKGGGGPAYAAKNRPTKRCIKCGKCAFSGTPCTCSEPEFNLEHRQEAPSAMIGFQAFSEAWAREAYRVLKPGGHLAAFGGTRTYHRMACAIEDAGFEIRDQLSWIYGSGFPKSQNVGKAFDKAAGAEREVIGKSARHGGGTTITIPDYNRYADSGDYITAPATDLAKQWDGWGTALKPAHEPICLARKPLIGTVAANVAAHGTGAINVDGCRVAACETLARNNGARANNATYNAGAWKAGAFGTGDAAGGRWPANVVTDGSPEVLEAFARFGERTSGKMQPTHTTAGRSIYGQNAAGGFTTMETYGDTGTAARFFYTAKVSREEREIGLDGFPLGTKRILNGGIPSAVNSDPRGMSGGGDRQARNIHPTVKPIALMQWLCRLVTPPGGTVIDPFAGSGSTLIAADREQFNAIGIEREAEYVEIMRRRISGDAPLLTVVA